MQVSFPEKPVVSSQLVKKFKELSKPAFSLQLANPSTGGHQTGHTWFHCCVGICCCEAPEYVNWGTLEFTVVLFVVACCCLLFAVVVVCCCCCCCSCFCFVVGCCCFCVAVVVVVVAAIVAVAVVPLLLLP